MADSLVYKLHSGKPSKFKFMLKGYLKNLIPSCFYRHRLDKKLRQLGNRPDKDYITDRVQYYNRLSGQTALPAADRCEYYNGYCIFLNEMRKFKPSTFHSAYFLDLRDVARWFDGKRRIGFIPGDVYFNPPFPAIVKSRLLGDGNQDSVLLKLDKLRHFMFVNDCKPFGEKMNRAIFRGKIRHSRLRQRFLEMYFDHPMCDCGIVEQVPDHPEWFTAKKTIQEHLDYKFIIALEGNDVASNLKWVMSSNSIAVMTKPTCETWFMEGRLIPNYHYILIKDDMSDLEERMNYYATHVDEAQQIINHAHEYVQQFFDEEREQLIQLLVMAKYLELTSPAQ